MRALIIFFFFVFWAVGSCFAQVTTDSAYKLDSIPSWGISLDNGWKFYRGDLSVDEIMNLPDTAWHSINPTRDIHDIAEWKDINVGWLKLIIVVDSSMLNEPYCFQVYQSVASQIYLNGKLLKTYGYIDKAGKHTIAYQPYDDLEAISFKQRKNIMFVRFSTQKNLPYINYILAPFSGFKFVIGKVHSTFIGTKDDWLNNLLNYLVAGLFFLLTIIHACFFFLHRAQKANIYFAISTLLAASARILYVSHMHTSSVTFKAYGIPVEIIFHSSLPPLFLYFALFKLFNRKKDFMYWLLSSYCIAGIFIVFIFYNKGMFAGPDVTYLLCMVECTRITFIERFKRTRNVQVILIGLVVQICTVFIFYGFLVHLFPYVKIGDVYDLPDVFYHLGSVAVPVCLSVYLSQQFAFTSKELELKLVEVEKLSTKTIEQEKEKQQILAKQNEILEYKVTQRTSELKQSLENLQAAQVQLIQKEKLASLGELTAGIAHEIQNPLNFVNNFSEVNKEMLEELKAERLKQRTERDEQTEAEIIEDVIANEEKIIHHGKRADAIVKGMLQHSRSSTGVKEPTDINALADEYLRLSYHGLRAKDKEFNAISETDFDAGIGKINLIPQDIGRVLLNLYNNAFYAVTEKAKQQPFGYEPTISVATKKTNNKVDIRVKDNGNGIPQKVVDKIFQPFFTTKPTGEGTGLGLSLSYDIIKAHGGEIKVETKEGDGSEFIILLPFV